MGVRADVEKNSLRGSHVRIYDPKDPYQVIKSTPMSQSLPPTPAYPTVNRVLCVPLFFVDLNVSQGRSLILPQFLHEEVLRKHIAVAGSKIDLGVALVGLKQEEDGVLVELSETKDGLATTVSEKYDWVIGADGGRSSLFYSFLFKCSQRRLTVGPLLQALFASSPGYHLSEKPVTMNEYTSWTAKLKD